MKITAVIAAYDESGNIGPLTTRLIDTLDSMSGYEWELIYIIEGADGTLEIANQFASKRPEIRIIYNESPSGLGKAFQTGFDAVSENTDFVVTMDADLNHQPEEIPGLVAALRERSADIVVGSRRLPDSQAQGIPVWKDVLSRVVNRAMQLLAGVRVRDMTSGFRVYRTHVLRLIRYENRGFAFLPEILMEAAAQRAKVIERPIRFVWREAGESKMAIPATGFSYVKLFVRRFIPRSMRRKSRDRSRRS